MSEYESSFLSLNFPAIRLITFEADGPAPPVQEKTSGLKEAFSTSRIRCSYLSFFSCSCILYASLITLSKKLTWTVHVNLRMKKANGVLYSIRRNMAFRVDIIVKLGLHKSWSFLYCYTD